MRRWLLIAALLSISAWLVADEVPEAIWGDFALDFDPWADAEVGEWCRYSYRVNNGREIILTSQLAERRGDTLRITERRRGGLPAFDEVELVTEPLALDRICQRLRDNGLEVVVLDAEVRDDTLVVRGKPMPCVAFFTHLRVTDPERSLVNELIQTEWLCEDIPASGVLKMVKDQVGRLGSRTIKTHLEMTLVEWGTSDPP